MTAQAQNQLSGSLSVESTPPFSVLMSLYAREQPEYLRQCLASLAAQTLPPNEIVLVYDGGLPESLEAVVVSFSGSLPLKIVRLPQNVGLGRALNAGLQACAHEWVCRMDTDDICHPERFARQLAFVAAHPQLGVCGSQIDEFEHTPADAAHSRRVPCEHGEIARFAKSRNPINHMTVCYRKSAVLAAGNYQHAPLYEDYDLWVRMLLNGCRFANLPEVLVYARAGDEMYRRRGGCAYAKNELAMQRRFYRAGFLSTAQWAKNVLLRLPVRLLPNGVRQWVYRVLLRK